MSYVNLHAQFPPPGAFGATEFEECSARNSILQSDYDAELAAWQIRYTAYAKYLVAYKEWNDNEQRRKAKAMSDASNYASRLASYNAAQRAYSVAMNAYYEALAYNKELDDADKAVAAMVAQRYGVTWVSATCVDPAQKAAIQRACELASVKGLGYTFDLTRTNPCLLNELNVCVPRRAVVVPGAAPVPPTKPAAPPAAAPPPDPVTNPGDKPPAPGYETCQESRAGAIATFGLLAVLIVGGGAFGYRQWKKRKAA